MSCKPVPLAMHRGPPYNIIANQMNTAAIKTQGFIFAFYHYSHSPRKSIIETIVSVATSSDCIHVAILPVPHCIMQRNEKKEDCILEIIAEKYVYTAFIGLGFEKQQTTSILNEAYEFLFVPVTLKKFREGLMFLESLDGAGYNYIDLPLTILPKKFKKRSHSWHYFGGTGNNPDEDEKCCTPSKVFCSQVGLILCYKCDIFREDDKAKMLDPSYCSPGELFKMLSPAYHPLAYPCSMEKIKTAPES